jgi:cytochrome c oxidase subunit IV
MLALGGADISRTIKVPLLVVGMLWMAWLIASRFMHLKDEKVTLVITVVGTTLFCAVALFVLIAPDGRTALHRLVQ